MFVNVTEVFEAKIRKKMRNLQFYALGKKFCDRQSRRIPTLTRSKKLNPWLDYLNDTWSFLARETHCSIDDLIVQDQWPWPPVCWQRPSRTPLHRRHCWSSPGNHRWRPGSRSRGWESRGRQRGWNGQGFLRSLSICPSLLGIIMLSAYSSSYNFKIDPAHMCHLAPRITQPGKERTAPAKWTTAEPAKSVNPLRSHQIPVSSDHHSVFSHQTQVNSDHHSVISHQCSELTLVRAIQVPSKTSGLLLDRPRQWPKHWKKQILWLYTLPSVTLES